MYIHAFDPGKTTGHVVLRAVKKGELEVCLSDELTTYQEYALAAEHLVRFPDPHIVVIEAFRLYKEKARDLVGSLMPAAESAGIIKYLCWQYKVEWVEQMASCKMAFSRSEVVAQVLPGYMLPKSQHERDALQHALYYWFNTGRKL